MSDIEDVGEFSKPEIHPNEIKRIIADNNDEIMDFIMGGDLSDYASAAPKEFLEFIVEQAVFLTRLALDEKGAWTDDMENILRKAVLTGYDGGLESADQYFGDMELEAELDRQRAHQQ